MIYYKFHPVFLVFLSTAICVYWANAQRTQTQTAPPHAIGDVVHMEPVRKLDEGAYKPHPHIVMDYARNCFDGFGIVAAPVSHSNIKPLGPQPVPSNPHLDGFVLQMETVDSRNVVLEPAFKNANIHGSIRHTIAGHQHQLVADENQDAAREHAKAATTFAGIGNETMAASHTAEAARCIQVAADHAAEANRHTNMAAAYAANQFQFKLGDVTPLKLEARNSKKQALEAYRHISLHHHASNAHRGAANVHADAKVEHLLAAGRFRTTGQEQLAEYHEQLAANHGMNQQHHDHQATLHMDPVYIQSNSVEPLPSLQQALMSKTRAMVSKFKASTAGPVLGGVTHANTEGAGGHEP